MVPRRPRVRVRPRVLRQRRAGAPRLIERRADVLIVGGGLGGVAAAIAAAGRGLRVVMSEPTDWIGGQLTSQAVPPDEHPWIETHGCTATYRALRDGIRAHYREHFPLTAAARRLPHLNPGACFVSRLGHEPRVALAVLEAMLPPAVELLLEHAPVAAETDGDRVASVTLRGGGEDTVVDGRLVPRRQRDRRAAAADRRRARHRLRVAGDDRRAARAAEHQPGNLQPVTVCFAVDHLAGEDHTIPRPARYDDFAPRFSWVAPDPRTNRPVARRLEPEPRRGPARDRARLRRPRARQGPLALPPHRRARPVRARRLSLGHHARELAAGRLPRRGRCSTGGRPARASSACRSCTGCRPRAASPACGCAATSSATRPTASPSTPTSARRGGCARSRPCASRTSPASAPRASPTASGSAPTGSTCTRRPAATPTSTSRASRSRSRSARSSRSGSRT